jgi:CheY-like chemotaxis protein
VDKYVLLVDDEEIFLKLVSHYLSNRDIPSLAATSGPEALDILRERHHEICAVILDISMPHMDGYEVSRVIREEMNLTELPILALTALAGVETGQRVLEAGMNAMLPKPFKGPRLMDMLTNLGVFDSEETA